MEKDSKIYLAGHRGMVGSALERVLRTNGYCNIITRTHSELDLTRQMEVEEFFEAHRPEYVFLAAAKVGGILANSTYAAEFIYQNIMIAANVIDASYKYGTKKLLNLGSSCIYPKHAPQPMNEDCLLSGSLEPTNEAYAVAKIAALKMCRYYNEQYGTNFISVMPTNLYGTNDDFNLETGHVLPALIRKFHLAKLLSENDYDGLREDIRRYPIGFNYDRNIDLDNESDIVGVLKKLGISADAVTIWGTGEAFREFMFVDELAEACLFLMKGFDYKDVGEIINIGTGKDIKIKDLAQILKKVVGFRGQIIFDRSKPDGTPRKLLNVSRISDLGWKAVISLEEGLKKTYTWYCNKTNN
jgi:GDP-L-fucose synthase